MIFLAPNGPLGVTTDVRTIGQHIAKVTLFRWNLCIFDYLSKPDVYYGRIHQNMMNKTEPLTPKLKTFFKKGLVAAKIQHFYVTLAFKCKYFNTA